MPGLKTLVGRRHHPSDPFMKLSDVERKPLDILSDLSETEISCLPDPNESMSDLTVTLSNVNQNASWYKIKGLYVKWRIRVRYKK